MLRLITLQSELFKQSISKIQIQNSRAIRFIVYAVAHAWSTVCVDALADDHASSMATSGAGPAPDPRDPRALPPRTNLPAQWRSLSTVAVEQMYRMSNASLYLSPFYLSLALSTVLSLHPEHAQSSGARGAHLLVRREAVELLELLVHRAERLAHRVKLGVKLGVQVQHVVEHLGGGSLREPQLTSPLGRNDAQA